MDIATENNAIALLKECLHNGDKDQLIAWFIGERELIKRTIQDAEM